MWISVTTEEPLTPLLKSEVGHGLIATGGLGPLEPIPGIVRLAGELRIKAAPILVRLARAASSGLARFLNLESLTKLVNDELLGLSHADATGARHRLS